jgi:predicted metal-dependent hydrolase
VSAPAPPPADEEALLQADPRLHRAVDQFNGADWYACHDGFEALWHETQGPMRPVLQGILQIAVGELHLERGNRRGATVLMGEGLGRLRRCDDESLGLDLVLLKDLAGVRLHALQMDSEVHDLPLPRLELARNADTSPVH